MPKDKESNDDYTWYDIIRWVRQLQILRLKGLSLRIIPYLLKMIYQTIYYLRIVGKYSCFIMWSSWRSIEISSAKYTVRIIRYYKPTRQNRIPFYVISAHQLRYPWFSIPYCLRCSSSFFVRTFISTPLPLASFNNV